MILIYGASDDLIEIEGDIREEFSAYGDDAGVYLGFSDGTLVSVDYDRDGIWRFSSLRNGSGVTRFGEMGVTPQDTGLAAEVPDYSESVLLDGHHIEWIILGTRFVS